MTQIAVVVEGRSDVAILRRLLEGFPGTLRYFTGGGYGLPTIARNLAVREGTATFVVYDADSTDEARAREDQGMVRAAIRIVAPHLPCDAFAFRPEIEALFLEAPEPLPGLDANVPQLLRELAAAAPKKFLTGTLKLPLEEWIESLPEAAWDAIRRGPQAVALRKALDRVAAAERDVVEVE